MDLQADAASKEDCMDLNLMTAATTATLTQAGYPAPMPAYSVNQLAALSHDAAAR